MVWSTALDVGLTSELARMVIGLPLWLIFWRWAQRLFVESEEERRAILRKIYLYGVVFVGALSVVANTTGVLAGMFRAVLDLPPESDIRIPLPTIIVMGIVWAYHALVLRNDVAAGETLRQLLISEVADRLVATPVSKRVNKVSNNDPGLLDPVAPETGPPEQLNLFG